MNSDISFRVYNPEIDEDAVVRIWIECGWADWKKDKEGRKAFARWLNCGTADVAILRNTAECLVTTHKGSISMLDTELSFRAVSCVSTGRPMRKMGGSGELTAMTVARAAEEGDAVAGLGIFDQGYYDRLGFGNFPYAVHIHFDPRTLKVPPLKRPPIRITEEDLPRITANTRERRNHHGLVKFPQTDFAGLIIAEEAGSFGLGFEDSEGKLTHHMWIKPKDSHGPYTVLWMVYRDHNEMLELLSVLKSLADQVNSVILREPWGLQFQDLLSRPFRTMNLTEEGKHESRIEALSFKQARILDMDLTLKALKLPGGSISFNLELTDPISEYLPKDTVWKGLSGSWTIEMGEAESSAKKGHTKGLPLMNASVNAFTRLIFGVATPTGLSVTDDLSAPEMLLTDLDARLRLPVPDMIQIF